MTNSKALNLRRLGLPALPEPGRDNRAPTFAVSGYRLVGQFGEIIKYRGGFVKKGERLRGWRGVSMSRPEEYDGNHGDHAGQVGPAGQEEKRSPTNFNHFTPSKPIYAQLPIKWLSTITIVVIPARKQPISSKSKVPRPIIMAAPSLTRTSSGLPKSSGSVCVKDFIPTPF